MPGKIRENKKFWPNPFGEIGVMGITNPRLSIVERNHTYLTYLRTLDIHSPILRQ